LQSIKWHMIPLNIEILEYKRKYKIKYIIGKSFSPSLYLQNAANGSSS
jgi:hypothetical protein